MGFLHIAFLIVNNCEHIVNYILNLYQYIQLRSKILLISKCLVRK